MAWEMETRALVYPMTMASKSSSGNVTRRPSGLRAELRGPLFGGQRKEGGRRLSERGGLGSLITEHEEGGSGTRESAGSGTETLKEAAALGSQASEARGGWGRNGGSGEEGRGAALSLLEGFVSGETSRHQWLGLLACFEGMVT